MYFVRHEWDIIGVSRAVKSLCSCGGDLREEAGVFRHTPLGHGAIIWVQFDQHRIPAQAIGNEAYSARTAERVEDHIAGARTRQDAPFGQRGREGGEVGFG